MQSSLLLLDTDCQDYRITDGLCWKGTLEITFTNPPAQEGSTAEEKWGANLVPLDRSHRDH